eukprot:1160396-Pelagomonas_calceolata.AAC.18
MAAGAPRPRPLAHRLVCVHCPPPQPTAQAEHKAPSVAECHSSISHAPVCRRGGSSGGSGSGTSVTRAALAAASAKAMEHRQGLQRLVVALGGRVGVAGFAAMPDASKRNVTLPWWCLSAWSTLVMLFKPVHRPNPHSCHAPGSRPLSTCGSACVCV